MGILMPYFVFMTLVNFLIVLAVLFYVSDIKDIVKEILLNTDCKHYERSPSPEEVKDICEKVLKKFKEAYKKTNPQQ